MVENVSKIYHLSKLLGVKHQPFMIRFEIPITESYPLIKTGMVVTEMVCKDDRNLDIPIKVDTNSNLCHMLSGQSRGSNTQGLLP